MLASRFEISILVEGSSPRKMSLIMKRASISFEVTPLSFKRDV